MLEGKAVVGETDMLQTMQQDALRLASKALDAFDVTDSTEIARFIKKVWWKLSFNPTRIIANIVRARFSISFSINTETLARWRSP